MREIRRTIRLSGLMSGGEETSDRQRRLPPTLQRSAPPNFSPDPGVLLRALYEICPGM